MKKKTPPHSKREKDMLYKIYRDEFLERYLEEFARSPLSGKFAPVRKILSGAMDAWFFAKMKNKKFLRRWRRLSPF